jgi:hypothetical protein
MGRTTSLKRAVTATFALAALLYSTAPAEAIPWNEIGDAGHLLGTAQSTNGAGSLTSIAGTLSSGTDVDLFRIYISSPAAFSASTIGGASFDTQLFLFNAGGFGVYANDDSVGLLSRLPAGHANSPTSTGLYYLGISQYNRDPFSSGGLIFPSSPFTGVFGPTGPGGALPLNSWSGSSGSGGGYTITLTGASFSHTASLPAPASCLLLGSCLAGLAAWRRRKIV